MKAPSVPARAIEAASMSGAPATLSGRIEMALANGECAMLDACITDAVRTYATGARPASPSVAASVFSALFFRFPHHPQLSEWADRARAGLDTLRQPARLTLARRLLRYDIFFGRPARAALLVDRLQSQGIAESSSVEVQIQWALLQSMYQGALGVLSECIEIVHRARAIAVRHAAHPWSGALQATEISAYLGLGDHQGLRLAWEAVRRSPGRAGLLGTAYFHQLGTQVALADGNVPLALEEAEAALRVATCAGAPLFLALACLSVVEVHLDRGTVGAAEALLHRAQEVARASGSIQLTCLCAFMRSYATIGRQETGIPDHDLRLGFGLASRHGYRNFSWWSPRMMTALCLKALERGVHVDYVQGLVKSRGLFPTASPVHLANWPWPVKVYTLGRFAVIINDQLSQASRKAQHKPLELFKVLIAQGGRDIGEESLTAILWPDAEGDAARKAFDTTLHRLRKLLGDEQALVLHDRKLSLDPRICWVDSWALERLLSEAESILADPATDPQGDILAGLAQRVQGLYHGRFLGREVDAWWVVSLRERLRSR
ncbi:MAG: AfsR/SARP family transcriptional regulator, partial [Acidiferrobacterales bacterium]